MTAECETIRHPCIGVQLDGMLGPTKMAASPSAAASFTSGQSVQLKSITSTAKIMVDTGA